MTFVTKVSKEGFDVRNTDNENLLYSSELASHSIYNIISVSLLSGATSIAFEHGLNFVPKVWIFMVDSDGSGTFMRRIPYLDDTDFKVDYNISDTNVTIEGDGNHTDRLDFKVIIFTRSPQA